MSWGQAELDKRQRRHEHEADKGEGAKAGDIKARGAEQRREMPKAEVTGIAERWWLRTGQYHQDLSHGTLLTANQARTFPTTLLKVNIPLSLDSARPWNVGERPLCCPCA